MRPCHGLGARSQAAHFLGGALEQRGSLSHLLFHAAQLLAHALLRMLQHHSQVEEAGLDIAERLPQIVHQAAENLVVRFLRGHVECSGAGISIT
jgi:hypothetical protein